MTQDRSIVPTRGADILAVGLGATVVIWAILYVAAIPQPGAVTPPLVVGLVGACLFGAGWVLGRAGRRMGGGAVAGLVVAALSMLVLAGLMGGAEPAERGGMWRWILGFLVGAVVIAAAGAGVGSRRGAAAGADWTARLAWVTAATALCMIVAGGIVTGLEAGLAVEGWLVPEGHLLVLFPLSLMRRDVPTFVEHAHRLWGLLVGLATILLAVHLWLVQRRRSIRVLAVIAVAAVVAQGILGGTRVTQESVALGVVHGLFAHAFLSLLVAIALMSGDTWRRREAVPSPSAPTERTLTALLLAAVVLQIVLGTTYRHLEPLESVGSGPRTALLHSHSFVVSALVVVLVLLSGLRAWGRHRDQPVLRGTGAALMHTTALQVLLGVVSFILVPQGPREAGEAIPAIEVAFTTAHQATGAVLLAAATALALWTRRLLRG
jgi:cytochrome c oxidase assembly protein subunit 15